MKETTLPACPGLVVKDGRYYFQARIPQDCLVAWQCLTGKRGPVYTDPLDTRDLMEARRVVRSEKWPHHDLLLKRLRAGPVSTIDDAEVRRLAALWIIQRLEEDDEARYDDADGSPERRYRKRDETLAIVATEMREAYALGRSPVGFDWEMNDFLQSHGVDLLPGSHAEAKLRRALLGAEQKTFDFLERRHKGEYIETPPVPPEAEPIGAPAEGPSLTECYEKWVLSKPRPEKTAADAQAAIDAFENHIGKRGVLAYARRDAIKWRDALLQHSTAPLHPKTVNKKLSLLRALVQVAIDDELEGLTDSSPNPFRSTEAEERRGEKPRLPYSTGQLNSLFSSPVYARKERPHGGRGDAAYWLPLLALFTGARLEELGQLRLVDVTEERGIPCLTFTPEAGSIKNKQSRRIPLHPELVRLGFLDYIEGKRDLKVERVFPDLKPGAGGKFTDSWSKWYGRYLRTEVGIQDSRITFHSFRHTFKDACREGELGEELHDALTGHVGRGGVGRSYGSDKFPLTALHEAIKRVTYPEVNLPELWGAP